MNHPEFLSRLRDFLNTNDRFSKYNDMRITSLEEGRAEAELTASERHLNGLNVVQGGALYTLADLAFAGAVNSYGFQAVGMSSSCSFVRPGIGTVFHAVAEPVSKGRRTAVFLVKVTDAAGKLVMHATMTAFVTDQPVFSD